MLRKTTRLRRACYTARGQVCPFVERNLFRFFTERIEIRSTTKLPAGSIHLHLRRTGQSALAPRTARPWSLKLRIFGPPVVGRSGALEIQRQGRCVT